MGCDQSRQKDVDDVRERQRTDDDMNGSSIARPLNPGAPMINSLDQTATSLTEQRATDDQKFEEILDTLCRCTMTASSDLDLLPDGTRRDRIPLYNGRVQKTKVLSSLQSFPRTDGSPDTVDAMLQHPLLSTPANKQLIQNAAQDLAAALTQMDQTVSDTKPVVSFFGEVEPVAS
eukprot:m.30143 g.30143  ORF g.30143 m.30143 type:complete len:175 (-) comp9252_c1_seq2:246-770(-)